MLRTTFSKLGTLAATASGVPVVVFASEAESASLPAAVFAQQNPEYYGHHMWESGWFLGPLMMILVLAAVVALVVLIVRWLGGSGHASGQVSSEKLPLDILKQRFARGEIDQKEYEEKRRILED